MKCTDCEYHKGHPYRCLKPGRPPIRIHPDLIRGGYGCPLGESSRHVEAEATVQCRDCRYRGRLVCPSSCFRLDGNGHYIGKDLIESGGGCSRGEPEFMSSHDTLAELCFSLRLNTGGKEHGLRILIDNGHIERNEDNTLFIDSLLHWIHLFTS